jgi:hypothetical protein
VSVPVRVDLESAVVSYRPAAGEERSSSAGMVSIEALLLAAPWRTFRWYFGQRHYSGTYWSSTQGDHVIYESRLELANLLLADFDSQVRQIVAQPFIVCAELQGQVRKHIVDYLWGTGDGPVVVDVVRADAVGTGGKVSRRGARTCAPASMRGRWPPRSSRRCRKTPEAPKHAVTSNFLHNLLIDTVSSQG